MDNKTYLLVGADGGTGSVIVNEFQQRFHGKIIAPPLRELDYLNNDQIRFHLKEYDPDVIFLVGAYTNVDKAEDEDKKLCLRINEDGIENFLKIFNSGKAKIIYISTDMVAAGNEPLSENTDVWSNETAINVYGKSKLAGEKILRQFGKENSFPFHIVRISNPLAGLRRGSFATLLHNNHREGKETRLVANQYITPTVAEDLARNLHLIAEYGDKEVYHDAVDLEGRKWSVHDIGVELARICGWDPSMIREMDFDEMYKLGYWKAPRGKHNELLIKNLRTLHSPEPARISTIHEALRQFRERHIDPSLRENLREIILS